ncbi:MAG: oxygen-independent coproporphyrinogen III oxidase [Candidatus Muproteobacteria bacterium RBG_16_64_11]|uniref:Coproporphyrinogen-III oxidase n=1 Tax=Candidatus Muproteobacteria bacterium RBG_16_64_11 TaxID=1817758 RepID=A0A1F6TGX2_9PROT|nr:MAG: oxygen-independent coproporphyrinogen III oxidase [Candidatus Muproteobacteria bacterium RBG_16_64_11]
MDKLLDIDTAVIGRYDTAGPRYTSYPTAAQFHSGFDQARYRTWAARSNAAVPARPLSLYLHLPFCPNICFYCACNKIITKNRARIAPYLERLHREIALQGALFDRARPVEQLHWGGGTPTFLSQEQMRELMRVTREHFTLRDDDQGEYGVEIDPRQADAGTIGLLRELGFNRISIGVQDFDPRVQAAVNRIQTEQQTLAVWEAARLHGFHSINVDLIYGLPHQTTASFARTLDKIVAAAPDRLSVFNYAHLPAMFAPQRRIEAADLPSPMEKLAILKLTIERLIQAGYVYIGMDHFARADDKLAIAQRNGTLHRNFQGYSTHAECDLIGLGVSAIGALGDSYSQNQRMLDNYNAALDEGSLPIMRGVELDADDLLRRDVIMQLICHGRLDMAAIEHRHAVCFNDYFARELADLKTLQDDGLVTIEAGTIRARPLGKLLIRNVCMVFDRYLRRSDRPQRYSKAI